MKPTNVRIYGQHFMEPKNMNLDMYKSDEIFLELIFYDLRILPQYYISNYGRLYSMRYKRLISSYIDDSNHLRSTIVINDQGKTIFTGIHKLELMTFNPILEAQSNIFIPNHKDGHPLNNYISNLEWATISENTRHALDIGLSNCKCENNSRSYLNNDTIHIICKFLEQGKSVSYILDYLKYDYGVERNRVGAIIRLIRKGQTYLDISSQYNIPGCKGKQRYSPEDTIEICKYLSDGKIYRIDELCDIMKIKLEDRKLFRNHIDDIIKGNCDTHITKQYSNLRRPLNVKKNDKNYYYYN